MEFEKKRQDKIKKEKLLNGKLGSDPYTNITSEGIE